VLSHELQHEQVAQFALRALGVALGVRTPPRDLGQSIVIRAAIVFTHRRAQLPASALVAGHAAVVLML